MYIWPGPHVHITVKMALSDVLQAFESGQAGNLSLFHALAGAALDIIDFAEYSGRTARAMAHDWKSLLALRHRMSRLGHDNTIRYQCRSPPAKGTVCQSTCSVHSLHRPRYSAIRLE